MVKVITNKLELDTVEHTRLGPIGGEGQHHLQPRPNPGSVTVLTTDILFSFSQEVDIPCFKDA